MGAPRLTYRPELDGLRGLAVVGVVAFHLWPAAVPGGFLGVDAFFVLSGYLITSLLLAEHAATGSVDLPSFWARRARRLLPALFVVLAAVAVAAALWWPAEDLARLRGDALAGLAYVANWRFVVEGQSYFDLVRGPSPLRHLWSLAIEEQLYLLWPLVAAVVLRRRGTSAVRWVALAGAGASVALLPFVDTSRAYYGTDTRAHALLLGAALATATALPARLPRWVVSVALAVVLGLWATVGESDRWLFTWGLPVHAVLVAAVVAGSSGSRLLSTRPLVALGKVSYGLYLWHWPIVVFVAPPRVDLDGPALAALRLALTAACTVASYVLVERPIRQGAGRVVLLPVAGVATAAVVVLAAAGARPAPEYLQVAGPPPTTSTVMVTATTAAPTTARLVLLVGDSVAFTFQDELGVALAERGVGFAVATAIGCPAAAGLDPALGVVAGLDGAPTPWADTCTEAVREIQATGLAGGPDLVAFSSSWETSDRVVGDRLVAFGTDEWDGTVRAELAAAVERLSTGGAVVALLTQPPVVDGELRPVPAGENERRARFNELLVEAAAAAPARTRVVDLAVLACDGRDPCPREVDGVVLRPLDGNHYEDAGAAVIASRIATALVELDVGGR